MRLKQTLNCFRSSLCESNRLYSLTVAESAINTVETITPEGNYTSHVIGDSVGPVQYLHSDFPVLFISKVLSKSDCYMRYVQIRVEQHIHFMVYVKSTYNLSNLLYST